LVFPGLGQRYMLGVSLVVGLISKVDIEVKLAKSIPR